MDSLGDVFELIPTSSGGWKYSVIYNFGYPTTGGVTPAGTMVVDSAGNLYGSTVGGGAEGYGTIFELSPSSSGTWTKTTLYSFLGSTGSRPEGDLIFDSAGNLYGTTQNGGDLSAAMVRAAATVFELSPNGSGGWIESVLWASFTGGFGGGASVAMGGVIFDSAGIFYGTTVGGGHNSQCDGGCGVVYKLSPNGSGGWTETVIHSFTGSNGTLRAGGAWPVYS